MRAMRAMQWPAGLAVLLLCLLPSATPEDTKNVTRPLTPMRPVRPAPGNMNASDSLPLSAKGNSSIPTRNAASSGGAEQPGTKTATSLEGISNAVPLGAVIVNINGSVSATGGDKKAGSSLSASGNKDGVAKVVTGPPPDVSNKGIVPIVEVAVATNTPKDTRSKDTVQKASAKPMAQPAPVVGSKAPKNATRKGILILKAGIGGRSGDPEEVVPASREELEEPVTRSPKLDVELVQIPKRPTQQAEPDPDDLDLDEIVTTPSTNTSTPSTTASTPSTSVMTSSAPSWAPNSTIPGEMPRPIVPKCCPLGQRILAEKKKCVDSPLEFIPPFLEFENELPAHLVDGVGGEGGDGAETGEGGGELLYGEDGETITTEAEGYDIIVGNPCMYGRYRLEPSMDSRDEFYLLPNGSLIAPFLFDEPLGPDGFCMDVFPDTTTGDVVVLPLVCFPPQEGPRRSGLQFVLYPIGLLLSVPFLITTLVLYAITPSLRDVHGKALICHVTCLSVAYTSLATVQLWGTTLTSSLCFIIACFVQFSFVACFLWLNVMCINTWWNMSLRPATQWCRRSERRRFVLYSMYAWSLPCLLMGVTLVMDLTPTIPSSYLKPRFGIDTCWFQTDRAAIPYFYGPVTALIVFNTILFLLTAVSLHRRNRRRGKEASSSMHLTSDTCYQRHTTAAFKSCLMLFGAMGVNWVMEVISFYVGGPYYLWSVTDAMNCLQGITIFCIFVLNHQARREIRARVVELSARWGNKERRVADAPQIDDFKTGGVVQRDSRVGVGYQWHPVPTNDT